ncbi:hypothetical protein ACSZOP_06380 [Colibacter massiliensis]|uniref:hypothetical protein n=1 Tax=Colibacter massiliensis TaxID=1852379 RepID=UPI003F92BFB8
MKIKELDCISLIDGRNGCVLEIDSDGDMLVELDGIDDPLEGIVVVQPSEVKEITYIA